MMTNKCNKQSLIKNNNVQCRWDIFVVIWLLDSRANVIEVRLTNRSIIGDKDNGTKIDLN